MSVISLDTVETVKTVSSQQQRKATTMNRTQPSEVTKLVEQARRRPSGMTVVDMSAVLDVLTAATAMAEQIDGAEVPVDDRAKSTLMGEVSRTLNRLADMLSVASGEAKMEYWRFKGFTDPRD